jgi:hypothetical protein
MIEALLDKKPHLVQEANIMLQGAVAEATARQCGGVVKTFHSFCIAEGYKFPAFTAEAVLDFLATSLHNSKTFAFFRKVLPSLCWLEKISGRESVMAEGTAVGDMLRSYVGACQRHLARTKPAVKKATGYSFQVIDHLLRAEASVHMNKLHKFHFPLTVSSHYHLLYLLPLLRLYKTYRQTVHGRRRFHQNSVSYKKK